MAFVTSDKHYSNGINFVQLLKPFPFYRAADRRLKKVIWKGTPNCPHRGFTTLNLNIKHPTIQQRCREKECRKNSPVRTGARMVRLHPGNLKWLFLLCQMINNLKSALSMKLYLYLGITQKSLWFHIYWVCLPACQDLIERYYRWVDTGELELRQRTLDCKAVNCRATHMVRDGIEGQSLKLEDCHKYS